MQLPYRHIPCQPVSGHKWLFDAEKLWAPITTCGNNSEGPKTPTVRHLRTHSQTPPQDPQSDTSGPTVRHHLRTHSQTPPQDPQSDTTSGPTVTHLRTHSQTPPQDPQSDTTSGPTVRHLRTHSHTPQDPQSDTTSGPTVTHLRTHSQTPPQDPQSDTTSGPTVTHLRTHSHTPQDPQSDTTSGPTVTHLRTHSHTPQDPQSDTTSGPTVTHLRTHSQTPPQDPQSDTRSLNDGWLDDEPQKQWDERRDDSVCRLACSSISRLDEVLPEVSRSQMRQRRERSSQTQLYTSSSGLVPSQPDLHLCSEQNDRAERDTTREARPREGEGEGSKPGGAAVTQPCLLLLILAYPRLPTGL
ncbi:hypothetical protein P4O66_001913 [Electrophorus voltai]|uniref:Uncharacterized protein n=1 Tax=Electrophorus voltai TaxID=2609070 RepID=A0AAD9DUH2_9TELE|nr:hypothetical protein P4O66_001913 [Electrophorus voltai]